MVNIGQYNTLKVVKHVDFGAYLDGGDGLEILIPAKYIENPLSVGDEVKVFVYKDAGNRLIATTERPYATVNSFAFLQVKSVSNVGAFLDWGVLKDLLVPFREQKVKMREGGVYPVYIYLDHTTQRIVASAKFEKFIGNRIPEYRHGDKVKVTLYQHTDIGYKGVVDNLFFGMLYDNELYRAVELGVEIEAYVKQIRPDGKIDLTLSGETAGRIELLSKAILKYIKESDGHNEITDSSSPEEIKRVFNCSKKDYKKALGLLYKQHKIRITPSEITLL